MNTTHNTAELAGRRVGRAWRAVRRAEKRYAEWLIRRGVSHRVTFTVIWIVRLALLAIVAYLSLVFALLAAAAMVLAKGLARADLSRDEDQPQWRHGPLGFGLYDGDDFLIYPHDRDDDR